MTATFYVGDAIEVMNKLPEKSVDLVLTSPPFLALRSYLPADHPDKALEGGSQATPGAFIDWLIDVVEACDRVLAPHGSLCIELGDTYAGSGGGGGDLNPNSGGFNNTYKSAHPEVHAVKQMQSEGWPLAKSLSLIPELFRLTLVYGFNPLTGRQTERWRLRNVVRWVRPNPPVGALGDKFRPATSELMVFCKSAKRYFDLDAVREPFKQETLDRFADGKEMHYDKAASKDRGTASSGWSRMPEGKISTAGAPPLDWWNIPLLEGEEETRYGKPPRQRKDGERSGTGPKTLNASEDGTGWAWERTLINNPLGAPPLDWWNIPPGGYEGAHYAVFPPELCIKPIKAMCPEKVCRVCGEPSRRIVEKSERYEEARALLSVKAGSAWDQSSGNRADGLPSNAARAKLSDGSEFTAAEYTTTGWTDCGCRGYCPTHDFAAGFCVGPCPDRDDSDHWRPGLVLDPFGGSGTTALVATGHGRDCILIDLDERNFDLALERVGPFILERGTI